MAEVLAVGRDVEPARMRQRRELLMLNGVELRDPSLTEADVDRETRKPFWEGIQLTGR